MSCVQLRPSQEMHRNMKLLTIANCVTMRFQLLWLLLSVVSRIFILWRVRGVTSTWRRLCLNIHCDVTSMFWVQLRCHAAIVPEKNQRKWEEHNFFSSFFSVLFYFSLLRKIESPLYVSMWSHYRSLQSKEIYLQTFSLNTKKDSKNSSGWVFVLPVVYEVS